MFDTILPPACHFGREFRRPFVSEDTLEKFETRRSQPLTSAKNKVIDALIQRGHQIREVTLSFSYRLPSEFCGPNEFLTIKKDWDFELRFQEGYIFIRPHAHDGETLEITVFYIEPKYQGRGFIAKRRMNEMCDLLFSAGAKTLLGQPSDTRLAVKVDMSPERKARFFCRHCGFQAGKDGWIVRHRPEVV